MNVLPKYYPEKITFVITFHIDFIEKMELLFIRRFILNDKYVDNLTD